MRRALARPTAALAALVVALSVGTAVAAGPPPDRFPDAARAYVVQRDDTLLWARGLDDPLPPASLAKLLTAVVLLGEGWDPAAVVTVSPRAASIEGSRAGLRAGERLRADDALAALLLRSANDACIALAEHAAGSVPAFVARMNARASALGMDGSVFGHPCGLDVPGQHVTARDLLALAHAAAAQPRIATLAAQTQARIATLGTGARRIAFSNANALVGRVAGVVGLKSGYTSRAGKCVIALAERDGHRVWLVMLDAPDRWWSATAMIETALGEAAGLPAAAEAAPR